MGLFDFFKKKETVKEESCNAFLDTILAKYFNGSKPKLLADAKELLELTKFNLTAEDMIALLLRALGCLELNGNWNDSTARAMRMDCNGKLPNVELKWLYDYCDLHYIHKNAAKEFLLLNEMAGRQIGMPAPPHEIKKVNTTGHLLLLQQLLDDELYIYNHPSNKTIYSTYIWNGNLYFDDNSKVAYSIPFLWIRSLAKNNVFKFNNCMDILNNEFRVNTNGYDISRIL